jgi:glycosyltransferase involved in cell wall biosynthesis
VPAETGCRGLRLLTTVTFNPNQFRAHFEPLVALDEVESVVLVADEEPPSLPKLRTVVPPRWLVRIAGRAGAKLVTCVALALRHRPDWVIGFNLIPHGINAVVAARAARTRALYYMIGGLEEWEGGGWRSDNALLGRFARPHPRIERLLWRFVAGASAVAVMGERARAALVARGRDSATVHVVPASVAVERFAPRAAPPPTYDLLTIGSLIERKRTADFVRVVAALADVRAAIVGSGPLEPELRALAAELGVADRIAFLGFREDTPDLLRSARLFMQTSRYEGLSIAVGEAMTSGLPVVATDVGETATLVRDGHNGFLVAVGDTDALAERARKLLGDEPLRRSFGERAAAEAHALLAPAAVAARYRAVLARHD